MVNKNSILRGENMDFGKIVIREIDIPSNKSEQSSTEGTASNIYEIYYIPTSICTIYWYGILY